MSHHTYCIQCNIYNGHRSGVKIKNMHFQSLVVDEAPLIRCPIQEVLHYFFRTRNNISKSVLWLELFFGSYSHWHVMTIVQHLYKRNKQRTHYIHLHTLNRDWNCEFWLRCIPSTNDSKSLTWIGLSPISCSGRGGSAAPFASINNNI